MGLLSRLFGGKSKSEAGGSPASPTPVSPTQPQAPPEKTRDQEWRELIAEGLQHAKNQDWGLYRNSQLERARFLMEENNPKQTLLKFLEVNYIDLNGPENSGLGWVRSEAFLAPKVIEWTADLALNCELGESDLKALFLEMAGKEHSALRLPLDPSKAWPRLWKELGPCIKELKQDELERKAEIQRREEAKAARAAAKETARLEKADAREKAKAAKAAEKAAIKAAEKADRAAGRRPKASPTPGQPPLLPEALEPDHREAGRKQAEP